MTSENEQSRETTTITRKGQVTIPKEMRERYGLEEGDEVVWESSEDGLVVRKVERDAGRGMLVDESVSEEKREKIAREMNDYIREKRKTAWK